MKKLKMVISSPFDRKNLVCEIIRSNDDPRLKGFFAEISCESGKTIDIEIYPPYEFDESFKLDAIEFVKYVQEGIKEMSIYLDKPDHADAGE